MFINLMKKAVSRLRQCWQYFREHIDNILIIIGLLLVVLAFAVAVEVPENIVCCLQELLGLSEKDEVLKFIGFCIAGVISIWLALSADKRANAIDATAKNAEAGQRQERLKNAIEHLGHKRDSVRMGGAYELFHLAKDIEEEDLRQTVVDILCAHIRQTTGGDDYQEEHKTKPSEEIQSLLTLLFMEEQDVFQDCSINLQGSYLNGATLSQALSQARLQKVNLRQAQLQNADLRYAQLQKAVLRQAELQRANFWGAQLQGAKLWEAQMQRATLRKAQLQGAILIEAQLQGAILIEAQLQGADLVAAQMQGTDLFRAQLQKADLMDAELQGSNLRQARLQGANLREAQLQGAHLYKTQLQGANLEQVQLQGVSSHDAYPRPSAGFESRIESRIDKPSDLTGIIFADGLQEEDLDTLCEGLSADQAQALREELRSHVGKPASNELPENSGAVTTPPSPPYTKEEAKQWIAEYNKAMEGVPTTDDS